MGAAESKSGIINDEDYFRIRKYEKDAALKNSFSYVCIKISVFGSKNASKQSKLRMFWQAKREGRTFEFLFAKKSELR